MNETDLRKLAVELGNRIELVENVKSVRIRIEVKDGSEIIYTTPYKLRMDD